MKILHLCSYYVGSQVYRNLFEKLACLGVVSTQYVFIPVRDVAQIGNNKSEQSSVELCYVKCLSFSTRIFFFIKLLFLFVAFRRYQRQSNVLNVCDLVHAHTLYSDGYLAYLISRKYNIPYVLTIRTTDVSIFEKYLPHWRLLTKRVIANARCLVFLSSEHRAQIERKYKDVLPKVVFIPNGIDAYWIQNALLKKTRGHTSRKQAIYVGEVNQNKNIKRAIYAFFDTQGDSPAVFTVVGGSYKMFKEIYGALPPCMLGKTVFLERTKDKDLIRKQLLASDVLIMPSIMETFGLAYLEAVSQCTPVVYSKGQGVDGLYSEGYIGFSCNPHETASIAVAIQRTLEEFPCGIDFTARKNNPVTDFSWAGTASRLLDEVY